MKITFDPAKNRTNIRKHRVDPADVEAVFYDLVALTREDRDHHEEGVVTLGLDGFGRLLVVALHLPRRGRNQGVFGSRTYEER